MAMFCKSCGKSVPDDARFCSACGTPTGFVAQPQPTYVRHPLVRLREGRQVAGVCAGFARAYGWDLLLVRILTVIGGFVIFPIPEIAYIVAWVAMPEEPLTLPANTGAPTPGTY
jgi:phage shock protein C